MFPFTRRTTGRNRSERCQACIDALAEAQRATLSASILAEAKIPYFFSQIPQEWLLPLAEAVEIDAHSGRHDLQHAVVYGIISCWMVRHGEHAERGSDLERERIARLRFGLCCLTEWLRRTGLFSQAVLFSDLWSSDQTEMVVEGGNPLVLRALATLMGPQFRQLQEIPALRILGVPVSGSIPGNRGESTEPPLAVPGESRPHACTCDRCTLQALGAGRIPYRRPAGGPSLN